MFNALRYGPDKRSEPASMLLGRVVARSKYVGWTDMARVSISGATSSKSGVDMSTPVHPMATPLLLGSEHDAARC